MVYTLAQGANNYNSRLHYSLYGGVEYRPESVFAIKELLPLVAIPLVSVAILTAILSFHVPNFSPTTGSSGSEGSKSRSNKSYSLVLSPSSVANTKSGHSNKGITGNASIPSASSLATPLAQSPLGTDNGQGIIGGMGGGSTTLVGSGTTVTDPTGSTTTSTSGSGTTTSASSTVSTPLLQTDTTATLNTSTNTAQAGVDVFLAPTSTSLSTGTTIIP